MSLGILAPRTRRDDEPANGWWPIVLPLALMMASDFKLRSRPVDQSVGGNPDLTVLVEVAVYGMAALWVHHRFGLRPPARRTTGLLFACWAFAGYVALTALWSPFPELGVVRGAQLLVSMVVAHVLATRAHPADLRRFAHAFIVVVLISVGVGVVRPFPREGINADRFTWLYVHPVMAGIYLALAILLTIGFLIMRETVKHRLWHPLVYAAALMVLAGALVATGTRGAALGCAVGLLVMLSTARGPKGRLDVLVLGCSVAVLAVLAFAEQILAFVARGETPEKLATLNSRTELWTLAMRAYSEEPLFGRGLGASRGLFLRDIGLGGAHNAFVNALVDNGAVGAAIFAVLLITLTVVLTQLVWLRVRRTEAGMLLGILAFFAVDSMTTEGLATPANVSGIWLLLIVAWTEVLRRAQPRRSRRCSTTPSTSSSTTPTSEPVPSSPPGMPPPSG